MRRSLSLRASLLSAAALLLGACAGDAGDADGDGGDAAQSADESLSVFLASYDVSVGDEQRLLAGVLSSDAAQVAFGEVTFAVGPLGPEGAVQPRDSVSARFLPVLGLEPEGEGDEPTLLIGEPGRGVYEGFVALDEPGTWGIQVTAELDDGTTREGVAAFEVAEEPQVPAVGDEAPRTENPTIAQVEAGEVAPVSLDSRAQGDDADIPDPHLHDTTIVEALETGDPLVVVVSTPTYCQTAFCGPLTDEMAELALEYEDRATFVQLEVWEDFETATLNEAAAEWIQPASGQGGNEPWVFLVDGDGTIQARWDNVVDRDALVEQLDELVDGG